MSNLALTAVATEVANRSTEELKMMLDFPPAIMDVIHQKIMIAYMGGFNLHKEVIEQGLSDASCPATVEIDTSGATEEDLEFLKNVCEGAQTYQAATRLGHRHDPWKYTGRRCPKCGDHIVEHDGIVECGALGCDHVESVQALPRLKEPFFTEEDLSKIF